VDEEHDASFKQQEGFHYSARDLAVLRAHLEQCPILLGSATPSFESLHNVTLNKYTLLELPERVNQALLPKIEIQDVRHKKLNGGLSAQMIDKIQKHLNDGQQVLIFLNRRGYAPTWMCYECAHTASCLQCDAKLIYHHSKKKLLCHHCHRIYPLQETCSQCQAPMNAVGIGTEKLEETLAELFPNTPPLRIDSDTTRKKGMLTEKLGLIHEGSAQLLIGTQLLAKGHHFPNLTLVAIVDVDGGLFSSDFRAVEKMGQLITQVAGRSGRAEKPGEVVLQTCHPQHPLVQALIEKGYDAFATELLKERQQTFLPPFSHLAIIRAQAKTAQAPEQFLEKLKKMLDQISSEVSVFGPNIAIMAKKQGYHRFQLTLQASSRNQLHGLLAKLTELIQKVPERTRVRWSLDVDPIEMS
jgi:primosomal protein N' (replication factor Y)